MTPVRASLLLLLAACASGAPGGSGEDAGEPVVDGGDPDAGRSGDALPTGAVSFFHAAACPQGWIQYVPGVGRFIVPLGDGGARGDTHGVPLAPGEQRSHDHTLAASVELGSTSFAGVAGGGNGGVAPAGAAMFSATTDPAAAGLPYVQLLVCRKAAEPAAGADPLPRGLLAFFDAPTCPDGWAQPALTKGRWLVGVPDGALPGQTFGGPAMEGAAPRLHTHEATGAIATSSHGIALVSGCCAGGYAASGTYPYEVVSGENGVDLPVLLLLQCRKL